MLISRIGENITQQGPHDVLREEPAPTIHPGGKVREPLRVLPIEEVENREDLPVDDLIGVLESDIIDEGLDVSAARHPITIRHKDESVLGSGDCNVEETGIVDEAKLDMPELGLIDNRAEHHLPNTAPLEFVHGLDAPVSLTDVLEALT